LNLGVRFKLFNFANRSRKSRCEYPVARNKTDISINPAPLTTIESGSRILVKCWVSCVVAESVGAALTVLVAPRANCRRKKQRKCSRHRRTVSTATEKDKQNSYRTCPRDSAEQNLLNK
jgi:hypothetical protein